ncbi:MAG: hypothetical protein N4A45_08450 [Flavobacteriales bacterium]|jgi:hypothetical protein|nr:hypothetical protein [Flavobacteriales bacterium]
MKKRYRNNQKRNQFLAVFPILTIAGIGIITAFVTNYEPSWSYNWNGIRKEVKDSIKVAELYEITSKFNRRHWIMENATESELLKLAEYPNGTVKTIAYEGLLKKKKYSNKAELILKAIQDTVYTVEYQFGCIIRDKKIGEYLIQNVLMIDERIPSLPPKMKVDFGLTAIEKETILSSYRKYQNENFKDNN